jgi:hypothetical protein
MEFQNVYVLQFVKFSTIYYIKCVCPRIWIRKVYVQEFRWESVTKISTKKPNKINKLDACVERKKHVLGHKY